MFYKEIVGSPRSRVVRVIVIGRRDDRVFRIWRDTVLLQRIAIGLGILDDIAARYKRLKYHTIIPTTTNARDGTNSMFIKHDTIRKKWRLEIVEDWNSLSAPGGGDN